MFKKSLVVSVMAAIGLSATSALADVDIPVVPASVMVDNVPRPNTTIATNASSETNAAAINQSSRLSMTPGVNEIVPVAIGHLNRIVTPFPEPRVETTSGATIQIRDNVVYVATDQEAPVTMFVTAKGSEARALSLTLLPQRIPPRELFLEMEGALANARVMGNPKAERWETSQPYVETLRSLLRNLALGKTPQGYTLHEVEPGMPVPTCQQAGLEFNFNAGQVMMGHNLSVNVGVARNVSGQPVEFREASCGDWDVTAVAAWPRNVLVPNERTEVFVVKRQGSQEAPTSMRPSLLGSTGQ